MSHRKQLLSQWLAGVIGVPDFLLEPASEDASFRSYFRLTAQQKSYIVMDAPPAYEDCKPFVKVQKMLRANQVNVPQIHAFDENNGFMLLSDFGSVLFLDALNADSADYLYSTAIEELLKIQNTAVNGQLPIYDSQLLRDELTLFSDWFIGQHLGLNLNETQQKILQNVHELLIENALLQPQTMVHRDYHSRNIMLINDKAGIIDFQDAVYGPITYDLASLLKDCYINWPEEKVHELVRHFLRKHNENNSTELNFNQFIKWFDLMAAQRHMKAIGIFCRLNYRDGKKKFLHDIPRTMTYLTETCRKYPELADFSRFLAEIQPKINTPS